MSMTSENHPVDGKQSNDSGETRKHPSTERPGLTQHEVQRRLQEYGPNLLPAPPSPGVLYLFYRQFFSPFIYILLIAAVISFALGQHPSGVFILIVLLINALIGTVQEYSAQRAAAALRGMVRGSCHVIRDGQIKTIDVEELVPGDVILLSSGDKVPADLLLFQSDSLSVDESMLTGESLAVAKNAGATVAQDAPIAEQVNRCFAGSIVSHGRGQGVVLATGLNTELGRIAKHVTSGEVADPPLMVRIRRFTYQLAMGIFLAIAALFVLMLIKGTYDPREMLMMTIGLAVSVIPEGLPAALTVALAIGMSRMANNNVIIRKLVAVESLGSSTFICSDKTGTLTVNELTIRRVMLPDGTVYQVTGEGVAPGGEVSNTLSDEASRSMLQELCIAGVLANESQLDYAGGEWVSDGDIVDIAFLVMAKKLDMSISALRTQQAQLKLIPYESEKAFSGSIHRHNGKIYLYAKGSPEKMLEMCSKMATSQGDTDIDHDQIEEQINQLAQQGFRLIALARKCSDDGSHALSQMTFLGMVAMIDPLRPEAIGAIRQCREGQIDVAMITGDHPATAKAIGIELGLCQDQDPVVTGSMLKAAALKGHKPFEQLIMPSRVFARIEPQQKEQIVDCFMRQGHFVAVTGDGVNDAPAMRHAHTGIAMGKRGTDVAKETADLIITDDNFASIVKGIEQGRVIYNNIRKVIGLLVATGFSAILLFFLSVLAGLPMPLLAVQLLWLNLIANGFQDVALAFEPSEGNELSHRPRSPKEPIFERHLIEHVLIAGSLMGIVAFTHFNWLISHGTSTEEARNLTLMLMVLFGNIHALNSRSETRSLFQMPLLRNLFLMLAVPLAQAVHIGAMYTPWLSDVLALNPIRFDQWLQLLLMASSLIVVEEIHKAWIRYRASKTPVN